MGNTFCKSESEKTPINSYNQYNAWKNDLFSDPTYCQSLFSSIFENDLYYAEASIFFDKQDNDPIGIKKYIKSRIFYKINKTKTNEECPICLDKLQSTLCKKYSTLECNHSFHNKCFEKHVKTQKNENIIVTCPMCRFGVSSHETEIARLKQIRQEEDDNRSDSINYDSD